MYILKILFGVIFFLSCTTIQRYDKKGYRHGKWKFYYDNEKKFLHSKGKFNHGSQAGIWKYYSRYGILIQKEKYSKDEKTIRIKLYDSLGRIEKSGTALLTEDEKYLQYYWQAQWKLYDKRGRVYAFVKFEKGLSKDKVYIK